MGGCICKRKRESSRRACDRRMPSNSDSDPQTGGDGAAAQRANGDESRSPRRRVVTRSARTVDACASGDAELDMRELVRQTMKMIREQDAPAPLAKLNSVAEEEGGWIMVIMSLIDAIPLEEPLGPAVITLFLDESPLPTKVSF
ncbi:unnamed protein product [Gongylonema pulchrum]|uniref:Uncharacterized protein n=1 Tax=Gongylonema pulchrum TaxID=637853 RepID=A0A183EG16_9BILA|nr:unnamed protein product [Gongylonema pulchrum]